MRRAARSARSPPPSSHKPRRSETIAGLAVQASLSAAARLRECNARADATRSNRRRDTSAPVESVSRSVQHAGSASQLALRSAASGVISLDQADQPSINYCFDLRLRSDQLPTPLDGEVESFELLSVHELLDKVHAGSFTPDAALAVIDFAIRHSLVNAANEPRYASLCCAIRDHSVIPAGI